ncbi:MAG: hypothetical protein FWF28_06550 [Micrococcales bacterium]|nr:hypothetical protein [Micrococcales bacterium]
MNVTITDKDLGRSATVLGFNPAVPVLQATIDQYPSLYPDGTTFAVHVKTDSGTKYYGAVYSSNFELVCGGNTLSESSSVLKADLKAQHLSAYDTSSGKAGAKYDGWLAFYPKAADIASGCDLTYNRAAGKAGTKTIPAYTKSVPLK